MNIGISTSFIIGGLLMLSLFSLNNRVMSTSHEITLNMAAKQQIDAIRQLLMHDMQFIGFGTGNELQHFNGERIQFKAFFYGQERVIRWHLLNSQYQGSSNPNLRTLLRQGPMSTDPGSSVSRYPVKRFEVIAFSDEAGTVPTTNAQEVRSILIEIEIESTQPIGQYPNGEPRYASASWKKLFLPDNLMF